MEILAGLIAFVASLVIGFLPAKSVLSYLALPLPIQKTETRVMFGGDMMFDRSIRQTAKEKGDDFILSCLDPLLSLANLVVANLEGPITENPSVSVGTKPPDLNNYTFTFPTTTASLLARHNIRLVSIGNNHILNFRREGLLQTKKYLREAGVDFFGDPDSLEADKVARIEVGGVPFSFVNWSDWTSDKTDHTVAQVQEEVGKGRVTIVYTHWGEEYVAPTKPVRELAHQFVDAGASLVVGSHPHVVQEHEAYRGKQIYYSLGNLVFDQYWDDAVRNGLILDVTFDRNGVISLREIPVELRRDRQTCATIPL